MSAVQNVIAEAWSLFDSKKYDEARIKYNELL